MTFKDLHHLHRLSPAFHSEAHLLIGQLEINTTSLGLPVHVTLVVLLAICVVRFVLCCAILCCVVRFCGLHTAALQFTVFALLRLVPRLGADTGSSPTTNTSLVCVP